MALKHLRIVALVFLLCLTPFARSAESTNFLGMSIVKVIPYESLREKINYFYSDCLNTLREPKIQWDQIEVQEYKEANSLQMKIAGKVLEDMGVYIWTPKALVKDQNGKSLPSLQLPIVGHNMVDSEGLFKISINVPENSGGVSFPIEFRSGNYNFRYILQIRVTKGEVTSVAQPVVVQSQFDFCTRNMEIAGWGLAGSLQRHITAPIDGDIELQSFVFDSLSYERRHSFKPSLRARGYFTYSTFQVNSVVNQNGAYPSFLLGGDVQFTKVSWRKETSLFRVHYGFSASAMLEQRPFIFLKGTNRGEMTQGMHLGFGAGVYGEFFSKKTNHYGDVGFTVQPLFLGLNHKYEGIGAMGHIGIMKSLSYNNSIGVYSFGRMFLGTHESNNYSSQVSMLQTHIEIRYGWLF